MVHRVDAAVGRTVGSHGVSGTGTAGYGIPLILPPGTNGLAPSLALRYDQAGPNGLLGMGWSIDGLPIISRCEKTIAQDGEWAVSMLAVSDAYCLNGNRLRRTSGTYGVDGSTYQTEIEIFSHVTAKGAAGNGPAWWEVYARNGLIYEYGNSGDSRIEAVGSSTARLWALSRIRDRSGNFIEFTYTEEPANGSFRPNEIRYTGNTGISPATKIAFVYEAANRPDPLYGYLYNGANNEFKRLDRIDVIHLPTSETVRSYDMAYEAGGGAGQSSRLSSIQECRGGDCLASTSLTWLSGTSSWASTEGSTGQPVPAAPFVGDISGDGRDDLVWSTTTTSGTGWWYYMLGTDAGYGGAVSSGIPNHNYADAQAIEWNGDGLMDILVPCSGTGTWCVLQATGSGFTSVNTGTPSTGSNGQVLAADIDGDGRDDLVRITGALTLGLRLRGPSGFGTETTAWQSPGGGDQITGNFSGIRAMKFRSLHRSMDFNGDGREDFFLKMIYDDPDPTAPPGVIHYISAFYGNGSTVLWGPSIGVTLLPTLSGDFNGDGLTDLAYFNATTSYVLMSKGTTFHSSVSGPPTTGLLTANALAIDYDGDGRDDLVVPKSSPANWYLARAQGNSFAALTDLGLSSASSGFARAVDFNGDALGDIARSDTSASNAWKYRSHLGIYPDLVDRVADGFGNFVDFDYTRLTLGAPTYTKGSGAAYPTIDYQGPMYVVSSYTTSNGIGGSYSMTYNYEQGRYYLQGRGFLGFGKRKFTDSRTGIVTEESYLQDPAQFQSIGALSLRLIKQSSGTLISETANTWSYLLYGFGGEERRLPTLTQQVVKRYEVGGTYNGLLTSTTTIANSYLLATGTIWDQTVTTVEAPSTANGVQAGASYVQRVYHPLGSVLNDPTNWCIGPPTVTHLINSHDRYGGGAITRVINHSWDTVKCRLTQEIVEPDSTQWKATTDLTYDDAPGETDPDVGNITRVTVTGINMTLRTTKASWGSDGRFLRSATNPLLQITQFGWDEKTGALTSVTDPNGLSTSWTHDAFARRTREDRLDGTATTWTYNDCASYGCVNSNNKMLVIATQLDTTGALVTDRSTYFDRWDRPIVSKARTLPLSPTYNRVDREYDALGRVSRESAPCWWSACTLFWTTFTYDMLGRTTQVSRPLSDSDPTPQTTTTYFEGLTTRVVDTLSKQSTQVANVLGGLARSVDHSGYYQDFDYDGFGNLIRTADSAGNTLHSATFNVRGMKIDQTDMNMGAWVYLPNALGELERIRDAKTSAPNWTTIIGYDLLGRMTSRQDVPEGVTSSWTWGASASAKNIGRLESLSGSGYSELYSYDASGRLQQKRITSDATYYIDYAYNSIGQLDSLTYPTSTSGYRLKLKYEYQNALLKRVKDYNAPSTVFWEANATDASGAVIDESLGNGLQTIRGVDQVTGLVDSIVTGPGANGSIQNLTYEWDGIGNLTKRRDLRQGLTEAFQYDDLHRLYRSTLNDSQNLLLTYTALGNINTKWEDGQTISYGYHATKKHALISAGTSSFDYDGNGNASVRNGSPISWYSYNLPNTISASGSNSSQFFYTPGRARWKQVASYGGTTETTIYIGGLIEKVTLGAVTSWKHYIAGAVGPVALYTRKSGAADEMHYLSTDHLGSPDTVTTGAGAIEVRLSFEAFGQRRKEAGWAGNPTPGEWTEITDTTRRGFTFHEMLDNLSLIHMNGRVYDPAVGRFLSADPYVQAPAFTQSFNRYSYTWNNPLSFTDPSGYRTQYQVLRRWGEWCPAPYLPPPPAAQPVCTASATPGINPGEPDSSAACAADQALRGGFEDWLNQATESALFVLIAGDAAGAKAAQGPDSQVDDSTVGGQTRPTLAELREIIEARIRDNQESLAQTEEMFERHAAERAALEAASTFRAAASDALDDLLTAADYASMVTPAGMVRGVGRRAAARSATSAANAVRLEKQLASHAQMGEVGTVMAGPGARVPFRDAQRIAQQYGGNASDWVKKTSSLYLSRDGTRFETHWVENIRTGQRVEFKTKFPGGN